MFFVSKFVEYSAMMGATELSNLGKFDPREERQRNVAGTFEVTFTDPPRGEVFVFADALKDTTAVSDVTGSQNHDVHKDPYMERSRILFSFDNGSPGATTREFNFNLSNPYEIGSLLFFKKEDILFTSKDLFLTYPFRTTTFPRTLSIPKVDGSAEEVVIDDEPRLTFSMVIVPAKDYHDKRNYDDSAINLRRLLEIISPRKPFLYVDQNFDWGGFILKVSPRRNIDHVAQDYNQQRIQQLVLEVA